ncbi:MAG: hypothetical protein WCL18_06035 [bacterium]
MKENIYRRFLENLISSVTKKLKISKTVGIKECYIDDMFFNRKQKWIIYSTITMEKIILQLIKTKAQNRNLELLTHIKRDFSKTNNLSDLPSNIQLLQSYYILLKAKKISKDTQIEQLLKKRAIRSQS